MARLTIEEVIAHCDRRVERAETFFTKEKLEEMSLEGSMAKEYWEHRQVREWLLELIERRKQPAIDPVKQEWISVKDRLPKAEERVLVLAWVSWDSEKKYPSIVCGMYEDGTIWREDSIWNWETDGLCEYDEERDDWKIPEGWFEYCLYNEDNLNYGIDRVVTHWMPLPEPPKEE